MRSVFPFAALVGQDMMEGQMQVGQQEPEQVAMDRHGVVEDVEEDEEGGVAAAGDAVAVDDGVAQAGFFQIGAEVLEDPGAAVPAGGEERRQLAVLLAAARHPHGQAVLGMAKMPLPCLVEMEAVEAFDVGGAVAVVEPQADQDFMGQKGEELPLGPEEQLVAPAHVDGRFDGAQQLVLFLAVENDKLVHPV